MFAVPSHLPARLRGRKFVAGATAALVIIAGSVTAYAANTGPSLNAIEVDGLVIAVAKDFPVSKAVQFDAVVTGGHGGKSVTASSSGQALIGFELPDGFTGDVNVTATSGDVKQSKTVKVGDEPSTTTTAKPAATTTTAKGAATTTTAKPAVTTTTAAPAGNQPGTGTNGTATGLTFPVKVSTDKTHLVGSDGKTVVIAADTNWNLLANVSTADATSYIKARKAQGFNTILTSVLIPGASSKNSNAFNGSMASPKDDFFAHLKEVAQVAQDNGVELMVLPAWSQGLAKQNDTSWTAAAATSYGQYLKTQFSNTTNIMWVLGGDWGNAANEGLCPLKDQVSALGAALHGGSALLTYHTGYGMKSSQCYGDSSWLDVDGTYWNFDYNNPSSSYMLNASVYGKGRPVLMLETGYQGPFSGDANPNALTAFTSRYQSWTQMTAGGAGFSYGANGTYNMPGDKDRSWTAALALNSGKEQGLVQKLLSGLDFSAMKPDLTNKVLTGGFGKAGSMDFASALSSSDAIVVYTSKQHNLEVNLSSLGGAGKAQWFDPTSGSYSDAGAVANSGTKMFASPAKNNGGDSDYVLVITTN